MTLHEQIIHGKISHTQPPPHRPKSFNDWAKQLKQEINKTFKVKRG